MKKKKLEYRPFGWNLARLVLITVVAVLEGGGGDIGMN